MNPPGAKASASVKVESGFNWALIGILLLGAVMRWAALSRMSTMLYIDEAYYGMDAVSLLLDPRLTPFFPANFGRESGWMYLLAPSLAVFGVQPFALRLVAAFVGVLTLAALYVLAKEILGRRGATWAALALTVLYWHVHMNHIVWRANLLTLIGALAFAGLLKAYRLNNWRNWIATGVLFGLLTYTYLSAKAWIGLAGLLLMGSFLFKPHFRRGSAVALILIAVISLPLVIYTLTNPDLALSRVGDVATLGVSDLVHNLSLWITAWFGQGDMALMPNVPGRPILDPLLGLIVLGGIVALPLVVRRRWHIGLLLAMAAIAVLPSLISKDAPHFLRANGLTLIIVIVAGAGALGLEQVLHRRWQARWVTAVPLVLLLAAGIITFYDFHFRWLADPRVSIYMEEYTNRPVDFIRQNTAPNEPVYFVPHSMFHPTIMYRAVDLAPRPVTAFDTFYCQVASDVPAVYVVNDAYEPDYARALAQWAEVRVLQQGDLVPADGTGLSDVFGEINLSFRPPPNRPAGAPPLRWYTVYEATPRASFVTGSNQPTAIFRDSMRLRSLTPVSDTLRPGDTIPLRLGLQALRPLAADYNVFAHLYGIPTPYEGGQMWSVADSPACISYPATRWQLHETVMQNLTLMVPPETPPGRYLIGLGIYDVATGVRLPLSASNSPPGDYFPLAEITVAAP